MTARSTYSPLQQSLHWLTALLTAVSLPLAWVMSAAPDDAPGVEDLYNLHKTAGILIFGMIIGRLVLRFRRGAPALPGHLSARERMLASAAHILLYGIFITMCVSGSILSATSPYPTLFFDLVPLPSLPRDEALRHAANAVHLVGQWAVYALLGLHGLGIVYHVAFRHDGLLDRMLPRQQPALAEDPQPLKP